MIYYITHAESDSYFTVDSEEEEADRMSNQGCDIFEDRDQWMRVIKAQGITDYTEEHKQTNIKDTILDFNAMLKEQQTTALSGEAFKEKPKYETDERFYTISKDATGCGKVKIRFLPSFNKEQNGLNMFVSRLMHNVNWNQTFGDKNSDKRWWSGTCPRTADSKAECPICTHGFDEGGKIEKSANKDAPDQLLRSAYYGEFVSRDEFITNIMITKDEINPANEGKIFLFKISKTVLDMFNKEAEKVLDSLSECQSDEDRMARNIPINLKGFDPFDLVFGKDFWLVFKAKKFTKTASDYWGSSRFDDIYTSKVKEGDMETYKSLVEQAYVLDEFLDPAELPTVEFLQEKLDHLTFKPKSGATTPPAQQNAGISDAPVDKQVQSSNDLLLQNNSAPEVNTTQVVEQPDTQHVEQPVTQQEPVTTAPVTEQPVVQPKVVEPNEVSEEDFLNNILNS